MSREQRRTLKDLNAEVLGTDPFGAVRVKLMNGRRVRILKDGRIKDPDRTIYNPAWKAGRG
jgi:hypothetical protein